MQLVTRHNLTVAEITANLPGVKSRAVEAWRQRKNPTPPWAVELLALKLRLGIASRNSLKEKRPKND